MQEVFAGLIRRFIAEHAHRMIFAPSPDSAVPELRPRTVNDDIYQDEKKQWDEWHEDQTNAERDLVGSRGEEGDKDI